MNFRLWFYLFIQHIMMMVIILFVMLFLFIETDIVTLMDLFALTYHNIPIYIIVLALMISIALVHSFYLILTVNQPYERVEAKLNWLLLGKYQHKIFSQKIKSSIWSDSSRQVEEDIEQLRLKLIQISDDLQELSAAPLFVGEQTKEEIIEHERNRIARELHDSVSQQLFAAQMMMSAVTQVTANQLDKKIEKQMQMIKTTLESAQIEMRALLLHLRPSELMDHSLKEGIIYLLKELQTKIPIQIHWELDEIQMESGIEDQLFRIVQEAISNTLRHADATELEVFLRENQGQIQLKISDNGVGFNLDEVNNKGSYGLRNMKERVKSFGGKLDIISISDKGTILDIKIPTMTK